MPIRVSPYLSFGGNTIDAMEFYRSVFGGTLDIKTFADIHASTDPSQDGLVAHAILTGETGIVLMGSDSATPGEQRSSSIALGGDEVARLTAYWEKLSGQGTVTTPFAKSPWGALFGRCVDQFGTDWLVNVSAPANGS